MQGGFLKCRFWAWYQFSGQKRRFGEKKVVLGRLERSLERGHLRSILGIVHVQCTFMYNVHVCTMYMYVMYMYVQCTCMYNVHVCTMYMYVQCT